MPDNDTTSAAVAECVALSIAFANAVDHREYDRLLDLFTDDAVLQRWDRSFEGRKGIAEMMAARPLGVQTRHMCTNFEITRLDDQSATGLTYFLFFRGEGAADKISPMTGPALMGEYHDRFRLTDAGWRIAHRTIKLVFGDAPPPPTK
jgi:ketosteroid isomerase-like protein